MRILIASCFVLLVFGCVAAQDKGGRPRVFVEESSSWEVGGGYGSHASVTVLGNGRVRSSTSSGGGIHGGARPQTAEIIKTFNRRCPETVVTMRRENADYFVRLEHEGGKSLNRDNKFVVFNKDGDAIASGSTRALGNAVKDACEALKRDWPTRPAQTSGQTTNTTSN